MKTIIRWALRLLDPLARFVAQTGISPNTITLTGLFVYAVAALLVAKDREVVGGAVLLFGGIINGLDGPLARYTGRVTKFGAFLDSVVDKFSEIILYLSLLYRFSHTGPPYAIYLVYLALANSLMVSYTRARAEGLGQSCEAGLFISPVRLTILIIGLLLDQTLASVWILATLTSVTVFQRILHVWRQTRT